MTHSAESSIYAIMLTYLQPFELAMLTGNHTEETYHNAILHDSTEYLAKYKHLCPDLCGALCIAAQNSNLASINWFVKNGEYTDFAFYDAARYNQPASIRFLNKICKPSVETLNLTLGYAAYDDNPEVILLLVMLGATNFDIALSEMATRMGQLKCIRLLVALGATDFDRAFDTAMMWHQPKARELLVELEAKNQLCPSSR